MNSKQRRQFRKALHTRILKKLNQLKKPVSHSEIVKEDTYSVMLKDFSRPNINGVIFQTDNLAELVNGLKESLPIYCELEPFTHRLGSASKVKEFESTVSDDYYSININKAVAKVIDLTYNEETKQLNGVVQAIKSNNYPGYSTLITDIDESRVFFGIRGLSQIIDKNTLHLLKIINVDVHFNPAKLRG
jgi:hypothetical protein